MAIIAGVVLGFQALIGAVPLFGSFLAIGIVSFIYSSRILNIEVNNEDGVTLMNAVGNNAFQVLCSIILTWTIVYNVIHNPTVLS